MSVEETQENVEMDEATDRLIETLRNLLGVAEERWPPSLMSHLPYPHHGLQLVVFDIAETTEYGGIHVLLRESDGTSVEYWRVQFGQLVAPALQYFLWRVSDFPMRNAAEIMTVVTWIEQFRNLHDTLSSEWLSAYEIQQETISEVLSAVWWSLPGLEIFTDGRKEQ